jgi:hypothetical protein
MIRYLPLRTLMSFSRGMMNDEVLSELLEQFNEAVSPSSPNNS